MVMHCSATDRSRLAYQGKSEDLEQGVDIRLSLPVLVQQKQRNWVGVSGEVEQSNFDEHEIIVGNTHLEHRPCAQGKKNRVHPRNYYVQPSCTLFVSLQVHTHI